MKKSNVICLKHPLLGGGFFDAKRATARLANIRFKSSLGM